MSRESYLQELWARLSNRMPRQELENVMRYYEEYFDEAGPGREAEVIAELGTPEHLAGQVMGDRPAAFREPAYDAPPQAYVPRKKWTGGKIALVICLFPIWLPLLLALFAVGIALIVSVFALVISLTLGIFAAVIGIGAGGIGCVAGGFVAIGCGFSALFTPGLTTVMFFVGFGLLLAGLGILLLTACAALLLMIWVVRGAPSRRGFWSPD